MQISSSFSESSRSTPGANMSASIEIWRRRIRTGQNALISAFRSQPDAPRFLRARASLVDNLLSEIWRSCHYPADWALIAVGGYGRGTLYPSSDIDLLILLPPSVGEVEKQRLGELIGVLWDIGLEIGHSVRTVDECIENAALDITVQTTLLEARFLAGSREGFAELQQAFWAHLNAALFFKAKKAEQSERHLHYQDTAYSLEPNCKESPGGLRDLHVVLWLAHAAGMGGNWKDLEKNGLLTHAERLKIEHCAEMIAEIRIYLHILSGRREDRILFEYQNLLAQEFGMTDTLQKRASEQFMYHYYQAAITVRQVNTILLQNIGAILSPDHGHSVPEPIHPDFQKYDDLLDVVDEDVFKRQPSSILEAFLLMQRYPELHGMTARTLRALWRARTLIDKKFRQDSENQARFLALFQSQRGIVHEFRRMNQYDILGRYLPAFGRIVGQMQHDLLHVFTVDQHILQVLRNLRRLTIPEFAHEYPLLSSLMVSFDKPWLLYIAALFHDIAKGRGGDHSILGALDARAFCQQHHLSHDDTELVFWLVKEHLTFSSFAQKNDISDPEVIAYFAAQMKNERRLAALYLLTVADIRGTSPKLWSAWKGKLLEDLFENTCHHLRAGGSPAIHGVIDERQDEVLRLLRDYALPDVVRERLWKLFDSIYFLRHEAEEIAWHTRSIHDRIQTDSPIVKARLDPDGGSLQVLVYTRNRPDLFVRLAGYFARAGFSIADAKIHTTTHDYALDSFVIFDVNFRSNVQEMIELIERELPERLRADAPPEKPPKIRPSRQVRHLPLTPSVAIEADERRDHYVLTIVAVDRPGLLFTVAGVLADHEITLHTAKITTLGERAEDVFLLSGHKLDNLSTRLYLEAEILSALQS